MIGTKTESISNAKANQYMAAWGPRSKGFDIVDLSKPIMVSCESITPFTLNHCMSDDGLEWYIDLMYFDMTSRNNNLYPTEDVKKSYAESTFVQESIRNRVWFGELEHPPAESPLSRFLFIEPTRYAWNVQTLEDKGDHFSGRVVLCDPLGTNIVHKNVMNPRIGSNYASSCRISTPNFIVKNEGGRKIYVKKYKMYPVSMDCVTVCGLPPCRLIKDGQYHPDTKHSVGTESASPLFMKEFSDPTEDILSMIKNSKESLDTRLILNDIYGIDLDNTKAILTKDNKVKLSTESGTSVSLSLNTFLLNEVMK